MKFVGKYMSAILALVGLVAIVGVACGGDDEEAAAPAAAPAAPAAAPAAAVPCRSSSRFCGRKRRRSHYGDPRSFRTVW